MENNALPKETPSLSDRGAKSKAVQSDLEKTPSFFWSAPVFSTSCYESISQSDLHPT